MDRNGSCVTQRKGKGWKISFFDMLSGEGMKGGKVSIEIKTQQK
jgi:hypothetical protein